MISHWKTWFWIGVIVLIVTATRACFGPIDASRQRDMNTTSHICFVAAVILYKLDEKKGNEK